MPPLTSDVRPAWLNPIRRIQAALHGNSGFAVVQMTVFVNENNDPVFWIEPTVRKIEPKGRAREAEEMMRQVLGKNGKD